MVMEDLYKIHENLDGKYLIIHANDFNEAVDFALENKLEQIQIRGVLGKDSVTTDFKGIEKLATHLKVISFAGLLDSTIINFDSIYSLKKIEKIYIQCKQNFVFDVSQFHLKHLGVEYYKGLINIGKIESLESIVITHYPHDNIAELLSLSKLKILHIHSSKIKTLEGIEGLKYLEELSLSRNNNLETIDEIKNIKLLNNLSIEKCKRLTGYDFINEMDNIKKLYINGFIK
jgi:internalin A